MLSKQILRNVKELFQTLPILWESHFGIICTRVCMRFLRVRVKGKYEILRRENKLHNRKKWQSFYTTLQPSNLLRDCRHTDHRYYNSEYKTFHIFIRRFCATQRQFGYFMNHGGLLAIILHYFVQQRPFLTEFLSFSLISE